MQSTGAIPMPHRRGARRFLTNAGQANGCTAGAAIVKLSRADGGKNCKANLTTAAARSYKALRDGTFAQETSPRCRHGPGERRAHVGPLAREGRPFRLDRAA